MIEMNAPIGQTVLDTTQNGLVGQPIDRVDGPLKVTGTAKYAYEVQDAGKAAYGYLVQSSIGKGSITSIDTSAAEKSPGVIKVLTWHDAPPQGNSGDHRTSCPVLESAEIEHYGQPVALVIAEEFEQARAAAFLVRVEYNKQPAKYEITGNVANAEKPTSEQSPVDTSNGDFESAFAAAPVTLDVTYTTPLQSHTMMEPHATIATWQGDQLTVYTANQILNRGQKSLAKTLKMPEDKVRVVSRYIGGGFGGKLWVAADATLAAIGSKAIDRPVKVALTRQQVFHVTTHRSNTVQRLRIGMDQDGHIQAIGHDVLSGNLKDQGFEAAANQTRSLYAGDNRETRHRYVPLSIPVASSMRAPGEAVGLLALECAMDELADRLQIDPIELRIRNEPSQDPTDHIPYSSRHLVECMREGATRFGWNNRNPKPGQVRDGRWLVGMGMAAGTRGNPLQPSKATVRLDANGIATARMAMTDIGTGTYTIMTQIAAEMLGLPVERVRVEMGDTIYPEAAGSGGSFGAGSAGSALFDACNGLRAKLAQAAGIDPAQAEFANGSVQGGGKSATLASLAGTEGLEAAGEIKPGDIRKKYSEQSYGAHFVEIGVDMDTGEVRLRRMLGVFTAGRVLNEKTARSQAIGGMIFGVGAALEEDLAMDDRFGFFVNHDMAEYHVAVHADVPNVDAIFLAELDPMSNPLKSKGIGELGICGAGAAVANAVYNACGVRVRDYPVTLDKIIAKLPQSA
jgi:xanthine dehydrogenase YagR molybdenum-binding subunit